MFLFVNKLYQFACPISHIKSLKSKFGRKWPEHWNSVISCIEMYTIYFADRIM